MLTKRTGIAFFMAINFNKGKLFEGIFKAYDAHYCSAKAGTDDDQSWGLNHHQYPVSPSDCTGSTAVIDMMI